MAKKKPPHAGEINEKCPAPDMLASKKKHFGKPAWDFDCPNAIELHVSGKGISINCSKLDRDCCIDNSKDIFVNSSQISAIRSFFEITTKYLGKKK